MPGQVHPSTSTSWSTESRDSSPPSFEPQVLKTDPSKIAQRVRPLEPATAAGMHNRTWITTEPVENQIWLTKRIFQDHLHLHNPIRGFFGDGDGSMVPPL